MSFWLKRSPKLISNAYCSYTSKKITTLPRNPTRFTSSSSSIRPYSQPIFRNSFLQNGTTQNQLKSPLLDGAKIFYYVDRNQVHHFKSRGYKRWFQNPRDMFIVILVSSGVLITVYFWNLETLPYTKRTRFMLLANNLEKSLVDDSRMFYKKLKIICKEKILPPLHPDSIRIQRISQGIIEGLQKGMQSQSQMGHLEGLEWEVILVNEPFNVAFCLPYGKIFVFTGMLDTFRTDPEIATIIAHEVGHVVARHFAEKSLKKILRTTLEFILYQIFFFNPVVVIAMSDFFIRLPFSRRNEMEADYIGLFLLASAGYDPRVAPQFYVKWGIIDGDFAFEDYVSTHPSKKKRATLLAEAKAMEEALTIYKSRREEVEGFLMYLLCILKSNQVFFD